MDDSLEIACSAVVQNLPALLLLCERACRHAGAGEDDSHSVRLAVEEACINIIEHGYPPCPPGPIVLRFQVEPRRLRITVADEAPCFDPRRVSAPDLTADAQARHIGGLGWHLITKVMDEVSHESLGNRGNRLTLVKHLQQPPGRAQ